MIKQPYFCKPCNYYTHKISHFKRHLISESHSEKSDDVVDDNIDLKSFKRNIFACPNCDLIYLSKKSFVRHEDTCIKVTNTEDLKHEIKELKHELEEKTGLLNNKETQLNKALDIAKENSQTANTSMNMLKYAQLYLSNAEPIEELKGDEVFDVIKYKNPKNKETINETYVKMIIHKFDHNKLADFIGNMVVEYYKPKSSDEANLISTDTSRLCFIIMQKIPQKDKDKTEKKEWINDKSGKKFTELVLKPLLSAIKGTVLTFIEFKTKSGILSETVLEWQTKCLIISRDIDVGKFANSILKYVGPFFQFDKLKLLDETMECDSDEKPKKKSKIIVRKSK